jgi:hypothetical protein
MKKYFLLLFLISGFVFSVIGQDEEVKPWTYVGVGTLNFTQAAQTQYFQAGGFNTISITGLVNLGANFNKGKSSWSNSFDAAYGVIKQGEKLKDIAFRKNDDRLFFESKYGYKVNEKWLITALGNFRSQFDQGLDANGALISKFLAPGYINFGVGMDFKPSENFSVYYSPVNSKITIVSVDSLIGNYMPQSFADDGKNLRYELGSYLNMQYQREIMKNVGYQTKLGLFTNYLENFGNIDVNWENLISLQVNKYISASISTLLIYDDDVRFNIEDDNGMVTGKGPRTQFRETLNIGLTYTFLGKKE